VRVEREGRANSPDRSDASARRLVRAPVDLPEPVLKGTWVVIAAYQEQAMVGRVVSDVRAMFPNVVVVDDGSADASGRRAAEEGAHVLRHAINRGQGAALQTGIAYALRQGAEIVATFDADGQHDPRDLPYLIHPISEGRADFVLGSRFMAGRPDDVPRLRRWLLAAGVLFTWLLSGLHLTDTHNGLRAFSRRAAQGLELRLDRMAHASELIDQMRSSGLPFVEVPVRVRYTPYSRAKGQSNANALRVAADYLLGRLLS